MRFLLTTTSHRSVYLKEMSSWINRPLVCSINGSAT
jgi:hypothetical protein